MAEIRCGHCGSTHPTVSEVRSCSVGEVGLESRQQLQPDKTTSQHAAVGVGPLEFGRSLVVGPGETIPAEWADHERFTVDAAVLASPENMATTLAGRWRERQGFVVELAAELPSLESLATPLPECGPAFVSWLDELLHAIYANSALVHGGEVVWTLAGRAIELGASIGGKADIVLPNGTEAWLDGGPLDPVILADPIVHSISLEAGELVALGRATPSADLAPDQLEAVATTGGPARIIAPAGSGKTRVLTERARHLIHELNLPASTITLVAFNKRAQLEMVERTDDLPKLRVRTLNALALSILNGRDGFRAPTGFRNVTTIDERDVRRLVQRLVDFPRRANADPVAVWIEALSAARLGLQLPAEVEAEFNGDVDGFAEMFPAFRDRLRTSGVVDFDEQIFLAIEGLLKDPLARATAQQRCRCLLVDEFQDLTPAHLLFIRLLSGPRGDVFGVGDDDQTIYGFSGANPEWLINYEHFFPGAHLHALEVNYRCAPSVVTAASTLLEYNQRRVPKQIRPAPGRTMIDNELQVLRSSDPTAAVTERIQELIADGVEVSEIAVLARVNVSLAVPQVALGIQGIPVVGAVGPEVLDRTGVRGVLAWLRLAADPQFLGPDDIADTVRRPSRGMSRKVVEWMSEHRTVDAISRLAKRLGERDAAKINSWADDLKHVSSLMKNGATTSELLDAIIDGIGLSDALNALDLSKGRVDRSTHLDDLSMLKAMARMQPDAGSFEPWLQSVLSSPTVETGPGITLSTVHRVKGLEWPHVIVIAVDQESFPHRLAEMDEERRVFHVAITRSSSSTTVVADAQRPSRFLGEMAGTASAAPVRNTAVQRESKSSRRKILTNGDTAAQDLDSAASARFEALRSWRLERAKADKTAPFIVFHDKVLRAIAVKYPSDLGQLAQVKGVGPTKLENYGDGVLAALDELVTD